MNTQGSYFKKALVVLMAVIMVFTYMPSMAWAEGLESTGTPDTLVFAKDLDPGEHYYPYEEGKQIQLEVSMQYYDESGTLQDFQEDATVSYIWMQNGNRIPAYYKPNYLVTINENTAGKTINYQVQGVAKIGTKRYTPITSQVCTLKIGAKPIDITLSVSKQGTLASTRTGEVAANLPITVEDLNRDGSFSVDEALAAAHKTYLSESDYASTTTEEDVTISKLWGVETTNASLYVNGQTAAANQTLTAGDKLVASVSSDTGETYIYAAFNETEKQISPKEEFKLKLTDENGNALSGIQIGAWENGNFTPINEKVTDANGEVSLSFNEEATYLLTAQGKVNITVDGTETERAIIAPFCKVECAMPNGNCGGTDGSASTATWRFNTATKVLTISGEGTIGGPLGTSSIDVIPPWSAYKTIIESVEIGEGITGISNFLFRDHTVLERIHFPKTLQSVGNCAFLDCKALKQIHFADGCNAKLGGLAFSGCTTLEEVELPIGITAKNGVFMGCTSLKKATVSGVGKNMFAGCTALTEVIYQEGATTFGNSPFAGMKYGGVNYESCKAIAKVWIPESLTEWGNAFDDEMLEKITFEGAGKANFFFAEDGSIYNKDKTELYYAGSGAIGTVIIPSTLAALKPYAFANRTQIKKVIFEDGSQLTEIPENCFEGCTGLKEVQGLPSTLKTLGSSAFSGCSALSEIELPEGLETINFSAFAGCGGLKSVEIPNTVKTIGDSAFADCTALASVSLSSQLEALNRFAFKNCEKLTKLELPQSLKHFGEKAVIGTSVEKIVLPENVTELVQMQFGFCRSLKEIVIKGNITTVPGSVFSGCSSLQSVTLPASITKFSDDGFSELKVLSTIGCVLYFEGSAEQWTAIARASGVFNGSVIVDYVEPTIETGKLELAEKSENISSRDAAELAAKTISMKFAYPQGSKPQAGDQISVNWYYATTLPDGLKDLKLLTGAFDTTSNFDLESLTATLTLQRQAGKAKTGTWHYLCIAFKTTADGETTMLVTDPIQVTYIGEDFTLDGNGTAEDPFKITSYEDLQTIAGYVEAGDDFSGMYFRLENDVTIESDWEQIGKRVNFKGNFDGNKNTITYERGAKSLFANFDGGTIKDLNLKGEYIASNGLAGTVNGTVQNCKLLSGSVTLGSGLVGAGGFWDGSRGQVTMINCEVQSGVKVGWNADKEEAASGEMGSLVCSGAFTLISCKSAADVTSKDGAVGGLAGYNAYAMRGASVKNSQFTGTISAAGGFVGGIVGKGYTAYTAPNTKCVQIENCYVNAKITGAYAVGGIFGGEAGCDQAWSNGIGYIRNNVFYGELRLNGNEVPKEADGGLPPIESLSGSKGAVAGFMRSLNKYNVIENNYYYITNGGTEKGIGAVEHIDTSKIRPMGMHEDGVYYYDTSEDNLVKICDWVDREDGLNRDYSSVTTKNSNRDDDPLGAEKDKLAKACTQAEMTDGTIVRLLNESPSSMHNWKQGTNGPELTDEAVPYKLEVSGTYKNEYYIGDSFDPQRDLSGILFTATWSDGTTTNPTLDDVTVTGFDSSKQAVVHLTATYENATCDFTVKIKKESGTTENPKNTIKVNFRLLGDTIHSEKEGSHTLQKGGLTTWITSRDYEVDLNATVWDFLKEVEKKTTDSSVKFNAENSQYGMYISSVTYNGTELAQMDNGPSSGWMYTLNGKHPLLAVSEQFLKDGDKIVFHYTDDYTVEEGSEAWNTPGGGVVEEVKDVTTDTKAGTTTAPTEVKVSEKTNADGTKTKVADVKVSADNQKEILKQAKEKKSNEIILVVSSKSVGDATKADVTLENSFIDSIVKDTNAKLTIKTPFGDKTYTQEELKAMSEAATGSTVTVAIEKAAEEPTDDAAAKIEKAKSIVKDMKLVARSSKTAKKNIKAVLKNDAKTKASVQELKDLGFTVKYRFYRSTKKASSYKSTVTKKVASYTNTSGKKGTKYFYKVQVRVYDENGKLIAKTALKQCKYATRTWTKVK